MPTYPNQPWDPLADAVMRDSPLTTAERMKMKQLEQRAQQQAADVVADTNKRVVATKWSAEDKLKMRLDMPVGASWGRDMQVAILQGANRVFIFVVRHDKTMLFDDDVFLYPSDSLVGQFRLFLEAA